jgi:PAS domain S-box-containing protein
MHTEKGFSQSEKGLNAKTFTLSKTNAYQHALDKTAIVAITDLAGSITYVNENFCKISKYTRDELIGKNHNILKSGYHNRGFYADLWKTIKKGEVWMGQIKNKAKDGSYYWVQTTIVPLVNEEQQPYQYLSFRLDITQQKQAEEQLEISKERLSLITSNFPHGSVSLIDKDLYILFTGGAGYEEVNLKAEAMAGKNIREVFSPPIYSFIEENLPRILQGEMMTHEVFVRNRYYQITYKPVYDKAEILYGFVMVALDITERHKADISIKRHHDLFTIGEQLAKIGSWELDVSTMELTFSSNTSELLGIDPSTEKWSFERVLQLVHPEDRTLADTFFKEMLLQKKSSIQEFRIIDQDGAYNIFQSSGTIYLNSEGKVIRIIGVMKDITERKKSEQDLLESRELLSNIADSIPGLVMRYVENIHGKAEIQYVSRGAELLWEIPHAQILLDENIVWKKIHPRDLRGFVKSFRKATNTLSTWNHEYRIVMDDGRIKWISAIGTPKKLKNGSKMWNILALDVTDRKNAEEIIEKNIELLTFQNTQLLDFCNIVSHNLRSPLINISMLLDFIEESKDEAERKMFIDKLKPVIDSLNETFEELVESIQIKQDNELQMENIEVEEYFNKILTGFEGQIVQTQAIISTDFTEAPVVCCPPQYFSSILQNLISNSLKYKSPDRRPEIKIKTFKMNHSVVLSVEDNGLGLDIIKHKDNLFKIRKVFHRHPDARGFGLFITKTQVEAIKGKIWVESVPNEGSIFYVKFNQLK